MPLHYAIAEASRPNRTADVIMRNPKADCAINFGIRQQSEASKQADVGNQMAARLYDRTLQGLKSPTPYAQRGASC